MSLVAAFRIHEVSYNPVNARKYLSAELIRELCTFVRFSIHNFHIVNLLDVEGETRLAEQDDFYAALGEPRACMCMYVGTDKYHRTLLDARIRTCDG